MALLRSCSVHREAELPLKSSSIFLLSRLFLTSSEHLSTVFGLWRNSGDTISLRPPSEPSPHTSPLPIHPPLIWWWLGRALACAWMWIATGCETDSQSRLQCLSPAWSSLQEGTKGALQGSAGWISSKEPMAGAAGWLALWKEACCGPSSGSLHRRTHTTPKHTNPPLQLSSPHPTAFTPPITTHMPLKGNTKVKGELPWRKWRDEELQDKGQLKVDGNMMKARMNFDLYILSWRCGHWLISAELLTKHISVYMSWEPKPRCVHIKMHTKADFSSILRVCLAAAAEQQLRLQVVTSCR